MKSTKCCDSSVASLEEGRRGSEGRTLGDTLQGVDARPNFFVAEFRKKTLDKRRGKMGVGTRGQLKKRYHFQSR